MTSNYCCQTNKTVNTIKCFWNVIVSQEKAYQA